jgi:uncharacterized peroxidase-related enzyme
VLDLDPQERERWLAALAEDWQTAELSEVDRALCDLAERMTRAPASLREQDVRELRAVGLDDPAIHHAVQVIAYFNYINRVADALGVDLEPGMPPRPTP